MGKNEGYLVEQWGEYKIRVTASGVFFVEEDGKRLEAATLDGLKKKIGGPPIALQTKAVLFDRWGHDDKAEDWTVIDVYGLSAIGNILYTLGGRKEKAGRHEEVRVFDQKKMDTRARLRGEIARRNEELETLMESWPRFDPAQVKR